MSEYSKRMIYLTQEQYDELIQNSTITANGTTITYNANDIYVTPQADPAIHSYTISGATPTIRALTNSKYTCGEVTSLNFTPCAQGSCEVIFTSGTTPTNLTLPSTVKMPEWFVVEESRIYDIIISDGIYGAVMSWQA